MSIKKMSLWIIVIILTMIIIDILFGIFFDRYTKSHPLKGDYEMTDHILYNFDEDIAVLGSSVALNSINTKVLSDSLGLNAYNGAANGQSLPYYLTMLKAIMGQKKPEKIVLGLITPNLTDSGVGSRYNFLAPYYGKGISDIDEKMADGDALEEVLLKSNLYRMNRIWFRIFLYNFTTAGIKGEKGFIAKPIPPAFPEREKMEEEEGMSPVRAAEFEEFLRICRENGTELTVVLTPRCVYSQADSSKVVREAAELCRRYGFRLYDDTTLPPFDRREDLFYDINHINIDGSKIYTDTIIQRIR